MQRTKDSFFNIRIQSVPKNFPLEYDVYICVANEMVLFRKVGDTISSDRSHDLMTHGLKQVFVPKEQRHAYLNSLKKLTKNDTLPTEMRAVLLKESAFNHIEDLFSKPEVKDFVHESQGLVEDMVNFISDDIQAAASLMKLTSHDYYTYNHSVNVSVYAIAITKLTMGNDKKLLVCAGLGGLLHDLGKRQISLDIINKPGKLSPEEWNEMKKHPQYGVDLVENVPAIPVESRRMIHEHHEHLDGTGYPRGIDAMGISKLSRIAAVADVFDALTTKRSYKEAITAEKAISIMDGMKEGKFDPDIFKSFDQKIEKRPGLTVEKDADPCSASFKAKKSA